MTTEPNTRPADNVPLGVATIVGTVLALSLGDALIKSLGGGGGLGVWQLFLVRSLLAFPVLLIGAALVFGAGRLKPHAVGWIALRAALLTFMWIAYYLSLPLLPLAVAAAAYYTLPLFIVAFAALFGGERVGLNAMFVLVGGAGLTAGAVLGLEADGFLTPSWAAMSPEEWRNITILAALILVASVGTAVAYQAAPASTVGTFDFAYVGFALIWGALFFGERPDTMALLGIALIVVAGVLAVRRPAG